jgi:hypothetical protein
VVIADVNAKHCGQNLQHILHTKCKLAEEPRIDLMPTVDELLDIETATPDKTKKTKKKKTEEKRMSSRNKRKPPALHICKMEGVKSVYYEASEPGIIRASARYSGSPIKTASNYLEMQDAYTFYKPATKTFPRWKTFAKGIDDLADMRNLPSFNDGFSYILACIDVFSRYAFAKAVRDKQSTMVAIAFEKIFSKCVPNMVQADRGLEFLNAQVQDVF